jgi:hypothetical protein
MDPNACLKEIRQIIANAREMEEDGEDGDLLYDQDRFLDLVEALDSWISKGGFLPKDWKK